MKSGFFHRIPIIMVVLVTIFVLIWVGREASVSISPLDLGTDIAITATTTDIKAPNGIIRATIVSNANDLQAGLSGRTSMPTDSGMLFIFTTPGRYGFWMKEMNFPLDMIWIGADKKVIGIESDAKPESYPEIFYPTSDVRYVLELDSGGARDHGIAVGTKLVF